MQLIQNVSSSEAFIKCDGFNNIKYGGILCLTKKPFFVSKILSRS